MINTLILEVKNHFSLSVPVYLTSPYLCNMWTFSAVWIAHTESTSGTRCRFLYL